MDVRTTGRIVSGFLPLPIITDRLIIRSYRSTDLEAYHTLLTDRGAMEGTDISPNRDWTESLLEGNIPPYGSDMMLGIFLKNPDGSEGDLIGDGGMDNLRTGGEWPSLNYRLKTEYWYKGYATEFARAFMAFWRNLPRVPITLTVRPKSVDDQQGSLHVTERVCASVKMKNEASQNVLEKLGFVLFDFELGDDALTEWRYILKV
ncbi:hypothetical protein ONS95_013685 [Cadophora gregata]|uniref:uncharacterized protein n=1 Tax=Cadophora gregata TaxID=51156 RepID=UPI0026DCF004|nr:uncharacterized protein ONS95_013685 [Cadophora gregata]KAK0113427.1 hypothetical protein ONS96_014293 [Cadophora gregata f. sp. sojae]KAK0114185.1 hypothetical protein ONS95_013685 [Cadophora gregata]